MVQLVDYIMKNEKSLYKYCRQYTKNTDVAWDLLQITYIKAINLDETIINNFKTYTNIMIKYNYINMKNSINNRMLATSSIYIDSNDDLDDDNFVSYGTINYNKLDYDPVDVTIDTKKVLEIMEEICHPAERQAIINNLVTDDARSGGFGKSFETLKASRRNGINKIRNYLGE